jgi:hypothetical protein
MSRLDPAAREALLRETSASSVEDHFGNGENYEEVELTEANKINVDTGVSTCSTHMLQLP